MDLAEICRVMRRRWYVLLPGLLLTAVLAVGAYVEVPPTYQSQSTVMLLNSQRASVPFGNNPFLSTQTALTGTADLLVRNLNSDQSLAALRREGATAAVSAKIADNALGPLVWLTAKGTDKDAVLASDRLLTDYARQRLDGIQDQQHVRSEAKIRMTTVVAPQHPVAQTKTRTEYLALAGLAGVVVSLLATFYVEAVRRRTAGSGRHAVTAGAGTAAATPAAAAERPPDASEAAAAGGAASPETGPKAADGPSAARAARPAPRWSAADGGPGTPGPAASQRAAAGPKGPEQAHPPAPGIPGTGAPEAAATPGPDATAAAGAAHRPATVPTE